MSDDYEMICLYDRNFNLLEKYNNIISCTESYYTDNENKRYKLYLIKCKGSNKKYVFVDEYNCIFYNGEFPTSNHEKVYLYKVQSYIKYGLFCVYAGQSGQDRQVFNYFDIATGKFIFEDFHSKITYDAEKEQFAVVDNYQRRNKDYWGVSNTYYTPSAEYIYDKTGKPKPDPKRIRYNTGVYRKCNLFGNACYAYKPNKGSSVIKIYKEYDYDKNVFVGEIFSFKCIYKSFGDSELCEYFDGENIDFHYLNYDEVYDISPENKEYIIYKDENSKLCRLDNDERFTNTVIYDKSANGMLTIALYNKETNVGYFLIRNDNKIVVLDTYGNIVNTIEYAYKINVCSLNYGIEHYIYTEEYSNKNEYMCNIYHFTGNNIEKVHFDYEISNIVTVYYNEPVFIFDEKGFLHKLKFEDDEITDIQDPTFITKGFDLNSYNNSRLYVSKDVENNKCVVTNNKFNVRKDCTDVYELELNGEPYYPFDVNVEYNKMHDFLCLICSRRCPDGVVRKALFCTNGICENDSPTKYKFFTTGEHDDVVMCEERIHFRCKTDFEKITMKIVDGDKENYYSFKVNPDNSLRLSKKRSN